MTQDIAPPPPLPKGGNAPRRGTVHCHLVGDAWIPGSSVSKSTRSFMLGTAPLLVLLWEKTTSIYLLLCGDEPTTVAHLGHRSIQNKRPEKRSPTAVQNGKLAPPFLSSPVETYDCNWIGHCMHPASVLHPPFLGNPIDTPERLRRDRTTQGAHLEASAKWAVWRLRPTQGPGGSMHLSSGQEEGPCLHTCSPIARLPQRPFLPSRFLLDGPTACQEQPVLRGRRLVDGQASVPPCLLRRRGIAAHGSFTPPHRRQLRDGSCLRQFAACVLPLSKNVLPAGRPRAQPACCKTFLPIAPRQALLPFRPYTLIFWPGVARVPVSMPCQTKEREREQPVGCSPCVATLRDLGVVFSCVLLRFYCVPTETDPVCPPLSFCCSVLGES